LNYRVLIFNLLPQILTVDGCKINGEKVPSRIGDPALQSINELLDESTYVDSAPQTRPSRVRNYSEPIHADKDGELQRRALSQQSNHPKMESDPPNLNQQILDRISDLEKRVQDMPKSLTPGPIASEDRLMNLEQKIGQLVDAVKPVEKKANIDNKEVNQDTERLRLIESQMKELIQITKNNENQAIIIKKTKEPIDKIEKQRTALKELEKQLFGNMSPSTSDEVVNIPKSPHRSIIYIQDTKTNDKENQPQIL
jgi:vacuolar-type H+-ATPase subunit I/STV1